MFALGVALLFHARAASAQAPLLRGFGGAIGFGASVLPTNDDASSPVIRLTSYDLGGLCFFGRVHSALFVNNNGHVSFGSSIAAFTPAPFPVAAHPMIAPWWADVDTRGLALGSPPENRVFWHIESGRLVVTWYRVGYYAAHTDRRNSFQLIVTRVSGASDYDVEFRYNELTWTTGDASGGRGGLGGTPAQAGFDAGDGRNFATLPGSRTAAVLALASGSNVTPAVPGLWRFRFRACRVVCLSNADCGGDTPICDPVSQQCRPCRSNTDCTAPLPACALSGPNMGRCVACTEPSHCPAPLTCDTTRQSCVGCLTNMHCSGVRPICDVPTRTCRPCDPASTTDCVGDRPVCGPAGACVECAPGMTMRCAPPTPNCSPATLACVACASNRDCPSTTPVCAAGSRCVLCSPGMATACANHADGHACVVGAEPSCGCVSDGDCDPERRCDVASARCVPRPLPPDDAGVDGATDADNDAFAPQGPTVSIRGGACQCTAGGMTGGQWSSWATLLLPAIITARRRWPVRRRGDPLRRA